MKALKQTPAFPQEADQDRAPCTMAEARKARFPRYTSDLSTNCPFQRLHVNTNEQMAGHSQYKYALMIINNATDFIHVAPLKNKAHAALALRDFVALIERKAGHKSTRYAQIMTPYSPQTI